MDALPLSLNRTQLELLQESIERKIATLKEQFSSNDRSSKEENLLTYGTDDYSEAQERTRAIEEQLKSQLKSWQNSPDDPKPVPLSLDPYQLKVLHMGIEERMNILNDGKDKELLADVIAQLPEFSLQEDAD